ncbi:MAG: UDP-N-acetylmuramoyl-L-alanyl-D-glutamate--2,6-diaminopimelate ligase [Candidatus Electronema sp. V4]|uniref:UDP-N-acetylmuramoyl-L-alanyl-D-glutamate--2, 6-diaminopimelate ligase n=1 Tax=Candidatus Electronema sp. V4 TaxID=3454756 RepID=UPI0040556E91
MKNLRLLLQSLPPELNAKILHGKADSQIRRISPDSREAGPGCVFVALRGSKADGHSFIPQAAAQGCPCVVVEDDPGPLDGATVVQVSDSHAALGWLAAALHDFPAQNMTLIGLTGTNGKTTISWLIEQMLQAAGCRVGVIGTVNSRWPDRSGKMIAEPAKLTTPGPVELQATLRAMADAGVMHVVMETSSHALQQGRLAGLRFDVGLFTNLTRDHLDFHGTMEAYFAAKKLLFTRYLKENGKAVIVARQDWSQQLCRELTADVPNVPQFTCGLDVADTVSAAALQQDIRGFSCNLSLNGKAFPFASRLTGRHNVLNILAAAGAGLALDLEPEQIVSGLAQDRQVPGRLERVRLPGLAEEAQPCVLVDYAHSPDALENVLRPLAAGRLLCVFGCGGDRDKGKRPQMGAIAAQYADLSIVTSDNPRSEEPETIIREVAAGCRAADLAERVPEELSAGPAKGFICITDRRTAVHTACALAGPQDIVLLAGKGHEDYQIIGAERHFFDDRIEAVNGLLRWNLRHLQGGTGGAINGGGKKNLFGNISTDTRSLAPGDVFVALAGEKFDGHDYVQTAVAAGAAAVIVHRDVPVPADVLFVHVEDTLQALLDLAAYRRRLLGKNCIVAAITGSCGKTTVKELVAAIFSRHFADVKTGINPVLKTQGNFNNLVGMPLSLLPVEAGHRAAVLEMGMNHPGEIARLVASAQPDIACITNVQAAHLEGLGSIEGVAKAKGELFAGMRADTVSVVNYDDPQVRKLPTNSVLVLGFAATPEGLDFKPEISAVNIADLGEKGMRFTLRIGGWEQELAISLPGLHSVSNCCAAAAVAHAAGIAPETIAAALAAQQGVTDKRMQLVALPNGVQVLNDCYNANPGSMSAALKTLRGFGKDCQHIALLGDMLELGASSGEAHEKIGWEAAELCYDLLAVVGNFAAHVAQGARQAGMAADKIHLFADTSAMTAWLLGEIDKKQITAGDWLLLKGSRGMRMEKVLEAVQARLNGEAR